MINVYDPEDRAAGVRRAFRSNIPAGFVELKDGESPSYTQPAPKRPSKRGDTAQADRTAAQGTTPTKEN